MYYAMRASAPSLHRESTDSLIYLFSIGCDHCHVILFSFYQIYLLEHIIDSY